LTPEGYIKWFKLDVQIELLKYDPIVGDYSKKITYRVVPYFIHQSIFSNPSSAPVGYTELMKEVRKEYNYIYTGQNVDILKFDININNLFFTGTNPSPENKSAKTGNQDQAGTAEKKNNTVKKGQGQAPESQVAQMGRARTPRAPELLQGYKGGSADKTTEQNVAENFQQAFISGNSADLVSVDLEILGDPYWLVDSGIGNYFAGAPTPTSSITNDGTMNYEGGNVYVYLTFKTPADVNVDTGLYDFSVSGKESPFGGIYRIVMVENYFQDGFWKQKLKCIRMPGPQGPEVNKMTDGATASVITKADTGASQIDKEAKPSSSMTDDSKKPSTTVTNNSSTSTASKETSSTQNTAKTTTTSNQSQPVAGYRYYRDLGQR
jgi:hypothetical protein